MALDPSTLQTFAQNNLGQPGQLPQPQQQVGTPLQQSQGYHPYQPPTAQALPDATAPLTAEQGRVTGLMNHPTQNAAYTATSDAIQQSGAAAKENAQEHLQGAADPLAVQKALQSYDFQTQGLLANFLGNQFTQNSQTLTSLAGQQSGALQNQAQMAQQNNQFGTQLGQQSSQFGAQLGTTQQSNLANQDLNQQRINAQSGQFVQSQAQQASQFGQTRSGPSGSAMAKSALGSILGGGSGGVTGAIGTALGSAVNSLLGNPTPGRVSDSSGNTPGSALQLPGTTSTGGSYTLPDTVAGTGQLGAPVPDGFSQDFSSSGVNSQAVSNQGFQLPPSPFDNPATNTADASQNFDMSSFFDSGGGLGDW